MPNFSKVIQIGHLVRDPELKFTPQGTPVASVGIATNHKYKDKEEVCFIDIQAFGKTAEFMEKHFHKGDAILVDGRLKQERWTDKVTGQSRGRHVIVVDTIGFVGGKRESGLENTASGATFSGGDQPKGGLSDEDMSSPQYGDPWAEVPAQYPGAMDGEKGDDIPF